MAANVCEDFRLQSQLANFFTIAARLLTRSRRGELNVVHTEFIESFGDLSGTSRSVKKQQGKSIHLLNRKVLDLSCLDLGSSVKISAARREVSTRP